MGGQANLQKLQHLKYLVDPTNMFVHHQLQGLQPVPQASPAAASGAAS